MIINLALELVDQLPMHAILSTTQFTISSLNIVHYTYAEKCFESINHMCLLYKLIDVLDGNHWLLLHKGIANFKVWYDGMVITAIILTLLEVLVRGVCYPLTYSIFFV